jgi:TonB family protein
MIAKRSKGLNQQLSWHLSCILSNRAFLGGGEHGSMKWNFKLVALAVMLFLGGPALLPRSVCAQDSTTESGKRKVRSKVLPEYPDLAKQMNVTGKVKIEATISADGHVSATRVVGGSPLLVNAALDALKKWRFEPAPKDSAEVIEFEFGSQQQQQ